MNAKDPEIVERFIELRSQGWTLAGIATELKVSKPTLIKWSSKYHHRIRNLRAVEIEALSQNSKISRTDCLQNLADDIQRIREELARRDLKDVPTARLFSISARLRAEATRVNGPLQLSDTLGQLDEGEEQITEPSIQWEV